MQKLFFIFLLLPFVCLAQETKPRLQNDTLYTLSGYNIYKGSVIEFNKGLERYNRFKYVTVKNGILSTSLSGCTVTVQSFKKFWITDLYNGYIIFDGYLKRKDGRSDYIVLQMAFGRAIENSPVLPSEIKVPDEFRDRYQRDTEREKKALLNMYEDKVITKTEYEAMKAKFP